MVRPGPRGRKRQRERQGLVAAGQSATLMCPLGGTEVAAVRASGSAEDVAVQPAAAGIALAGEAVALVAVDVGPAGAGDPDQRLRLGAGAVLGVPAVAVVLALQGLGADRLRA